MHRSVGGTYLYMCIYDVFLKQNSRTAQELREHILLTWMDPFQEFLDLVHPNKKTAAASETPSASLAGSMGELKSGIRLSIGFRSKPAR